MQKPLKLNNEVQIKLKKKTEERSVDKYLKERLTEKDKYGLSELAETFWQEKTKAREIKWSGGEGKAKPMLSVKHRPEAEKMLNFLRMQQTFPRPSSAGINKF